MPSTNISTLIMLQRAVTKVGARWVGLQEGIFPALPVLVFVNPQTDHQLEMPLELTSTRAEDLIPIIARQLNQDTGDFFNRSVSIRVSALRKISSSLKDLAAEIDSLLVERKKS